MGIYRPKLLIHQPFGRRKASSKVCRSPHCGLNGPTNFCCGAICTKCILVVVRKHRTLSQLPLQVNKNGDKRKDYARLCVNKFHSHPHPQPQPLSELSLCASIYVSIYLQLCIHVLTSQMHEIIISIIYPKICLQPATVSRLIPYPCRRRWTASCKTCWMASAEPASGGTSGVEALTNCLGNSQFQATEMEKSNKFRRTKLVENLWFQSETMEPILFRE